MDTLNVLFQHNLLNVYIPIIKQVGFSHPITLAIIVGHNSLSLTYLFFIVVLAYPVFSNKTWILPMLVTLFWTLISLSIILNLSLSIKTAITLILPHGSLEFLAIFYWINAMRKATCDKLFPKFDNTPNFKDYIRAFMKPAELKHLIKLDIINAFTASKLTLIILWPRLKKSYIIMLCLIFLAGIIETYLTPLVYL